MRTFSRPVVVALVLLAVGCGTAPGDRAPSEPPPISARDHAPAPGASATPEETPAPEARPAEATETPAPPEPPEPKIATDPVAVAAPPPPTPAPPAVDPLQQMRDEQVRAEDKRLALERARDRMTAAQRDVATLEKRLLAVKNPLLPRPQLPPEEAKAWEGLDGVARAKRVEEQLAAARTELEAATKAFTDLGGRID